MFEKKQYLFIFFVHVVMINDNAKKRNVAIIMCLYTTKNKMIGQTVRI
jgi:hypothetical protein